MEFVAQLYLLFHRFGHSVRKIIARRLTGRCELERIVCQRFTCLDFFPFTRHSSRHRHREEWSDAQALANRALNVGVCLRRSRVLQPISSELFRCNIESDLHLRTQASHYAHLIVRRKRIHDTVQIVDALTRCLQHLLSVNYLATAMQQLTRVQFDASNQLHSSLLLSIWSQLQPGVALNATADCVSDQWPILGFQNSRPYSDFRAMGCAAMLAMQQTAMHAQTDVIRIVNYTQLHGPIKCFPLACTIITLTSDLIQLTQQHTIDSLYLMDCDVCKLMNDNKTKQLDEKDASNDTTMSVDMANPLTTPSPLLSRLIQLHRSLSATLLIRFQHFWHRHSPQSIMDFNFVHKRFLQQVRHEANHRPTMSSWSTHSTPIEQFDSTLWPSSSNSSTSNDI